MRPTIWYT
ncbi:hypothetical protein F383_22752 [Gossypium arboreum]|uniref:Uncharacterized protein n=1 Tax=Gossypium arboreum TaxID=29729 RepID=A0A0B0NXV9_GOSAR|nr:hypothetical protein F383_22752 [Gossypium arboreum]